MLDDHIINATFKLPIPMRDYETANIIAAGAAISVTHPHEGL